MDEIAAMRTIERGYALSKRQAVKARQRAEERANAVLRQITDPAARERVTLWVAAKFSTEGT